MVVMRTIIIHASYKYAAKTDIFGLLGDAPVQIVDVSDEARVKAFFDFADESQRKGSPLRSFCLPSPLDNNQR